MARILLLFLICFPFGYGAKSDFFPTELPNQQWLQFDAEDYANPVSGVIYRSGDPVVCGMPLGGIDTGCIDLETTGLWGYSSIFGSIVPRNGPINLPFLGLSVDGETWVLCEDAPKGAEYHFGHREGYGPIEPILKKLDLKGVSLVNSIDYWGHYPIADLQYNLDAPVRVSMRAWSPFLPGDVQHSMIPGAIFDVQITNTSEVDKSGTLAFSFPGPTLNEAGSAYFQRTHVDEHLNGVGVESKLSSYFLGVIGQDRVRYGGGLADNGVAWSNISQKLPDSKKTDAGSSVAVDFTLKPGETSTVSFILSWSAPYWYASGRAGGKKENRVTDVWICPDGKWTERAVPVAQMTAQTHDRAHPAEFDVELDVQRGQRISLFLGALEKGHPVDYAGLEMNVEAIDLVSPSSDDILVGHSWSLGEEWSDLENPNGVWEYADGAGGRLLPLYSKVDDWIPNDILGGSTTDSQPAWALGPNRAGVAKIANDNPFGTDTITRKGDIVALPWTSIRWVSPISGKVRITGKAWMARESIAGDADTRYTHMYDKFYPDPIATAQFLSINKENLLSRIIAWQSVIYDDETLPVWLRDSLVNILHLLTETSLWAQKTDVMPDWVREEDGLFGLNESPRDCPQMECIPCSFYGNLPLAYFFPGLQLSTLRGYANYQRPSDGCPAWVFGYNAGMTQPSYNQYQASTNGISIAGIADRFITLHDTEDAAYAEEFYPMIKSVMDYSIFTAKDSYPEYSTGEQMIAMPTKFGNKQWFEADHPGWMGMVAHVGLLRLAQARITERIARSVGDLEYADEMRRLVNLGAEAMEKNLWDQRGYYLQFYEPNEQIRSEYVFGYQLDGEWVVDLYGLEGILPPHRIEQTLETIEKKNIRLSETGAVNYANPDGSSYTTQEGWDYGSYGYFPPEAWMLSMTYMYNGQVEFGEALAKRVMENIVLQKGYTWDAPNLISGRKDDGIRQFGRDYYQNMIIWSLPSALKGADFTRPAQEGGLVHRILDASSGSSGPTDINHELLILENK